jgi:acetyl esterase/lipase
MAPYRLTRASALAAALAAGLGVAALGLPGAAAGPIGQQRAQAAPAVDRVEVRGRAGQRRPGRRRATPARRVGARFALDGPRGTEVLRNRHYGPFGPTLDVYRRTGLPGPAPAVLLVHGGGWGGGGKGRMAPVAIALARAGMVAVNVGYSLAAPGFAGYPRQPHELRAAVRWIRRNAGRIGVDRRRIGAFGSSAGGHLAALLATRGAGPTTAGARIGAAVLWSAPLDLPMLARHRMLGPAAANLLGCHLAACAQRWAEASPLAHVTPDDAPLLLINSRREMVPAAQAEQMAARLSAAAVDHELWLLEGHAHGREYAPLVLDRSVAFLRERLLR